MYARILKSPLQQAHSFFLFGPRGTGKTSWLKTSVPEALYFDLLNSEDFLELSANPTRLEQRIPARFQGWIVLDEVQKVPPLLNEVHRLIENRHQKFILTGSSSRSLRKKGVNLLAGRAFTYHMHPLSALEQGTDFDLKRSLEFGHLPAIFSSSHPEKYLESYTQTYVREEVLQEGLTRNIGAFARFLETASFSQAEQLSVSEVARDAQVPRKVAESYFYILEDLLLADRIPVFTRRAKRKLAHHAKFYFFDVGIFRVLRPKGPLDTVAETEGAALETLFLQEIRAMNDYFELGYKIYFWRTLNQLEVDFILYGKHGLWAFEIKRKTQLGTSDFKGLRMFKADYPEANCMLLHCGTRWYQEGDIQVAPFVEVLKKLSEILTG